MKQTVTESRFHEAFHNAGRADQFSRAARSALFEYLEDIEAGCGEEIELDVVAICCDWTEYASATEAAEAYGWECPESDDEKNDLSDREALQYLNDETTVLELSSGVLVFNF
jgi:hypothetical protein